jgi:hypothetical protein
VSCSGSRSNIQELHHRWSKMKGAVHMMATAATTGPPSSKAPAAVLQFSSAQLAGMQRTSARLLLLKYNRSSSGRALAAVCCSWMLDRQLTSIASGLPPLPALLLLLVVLLLAKCAVSLLAAAWFCWQNITRAASTVSMPGTACSCCSSRLRNEPPNCEATRGSCRTQHAEAVESVFKSAKMPATYNSKPRIAASSCINPGPTS